MNCGCEMCKVPVGYDVIEYLKIAAGDIRIKPFFRRFFKYCIEKYDRKTERLKEEDPECGVGLFRIRMPLPGCMEDEFLEISRIYPELKEFLEVTVESKYKR